MNIVNFMYALFSINSYLPDYSSITIHSQNNRTGAFIVIYFMSLVDLENSNFHQCTDICTCVFKMIKSVAIPQNCQR